MGLPHLLAHPGILRALSPHYAIAFLVDRPVVAFIAMGAVVLTITGAEALYADMGHFGRRPIALAWACLVLPALLINYLGQGALILSTPSAVANPFFSRVPEALRIPLVVLATAATVIASQAVISGAFSVSRQATRLTLLPKLKVTQTSPEHSGQIYVGSANLLKVPDGGWLPLVIAAVLTTVMLTWRRGARLVAARRRAMEGSLEDFVAGPARTVPRAPGLAVYPHPEPATVPLALRTGVEMTHVLHEHVVILTLVHRGVPHVHRDDRVQVDVLGDPSDGIVHVSYQVGFHDSQDVPAARRCDRAAWAGAPRLHRGLRRVCAAARSGSGVGDVCAVRAAARARP